MRFRAMAIATCVAGQASGVAVLGFSGCGGTVAHDHGSEDAAEEGLDGSPLDATFDAQPTGDAALDSSIGDASSVDADAEVVDASPSDADAGCAPGSLRCSGKQPQACEPTGVWQNIGAACSDVCTAGICTGDCVPGSSQCSGNLVQQCDTTGQWQTVTTCAQPTPDCQGSACVCAETICGGQCVDMQTDQSNCGACGHDCLGGPCQGGLCDPIILYTGSTSPWSDVADIALSDTRIYYSNGYQQGWIYSVPLGGGAPVGVSGGDVAPTGIATDTTSVYWVDGAGCSPNCPGNVFKASLDADAQGAVSLYSGGNHMRDIAVDDTNAYWTDWGISADVGTVMAIGLNGGTPTTLASGLHNPNSIALDTANVYWVESNNAVMTVPKSGGTPVTLAAANLPLDLVVDSTNAYWCDLGTNTVLTVPTTGGTPTPLASNQMSLGWGIAVDGTNVYWANAGAMLTMPKGGGTPTTVTSGNWSGATTIMVDVNAIYWISSLGNAPVILKVAK